MKYVITGSLGNISKPLTVALIQAGHDVTVISSNPERAEAIKALGATPAIGSVHDTQFLTQAFTGADAVYSMVPPDITAEDWKDAIHQTGKGIVTAIKAAGVKKVVNLSSIGADMPEGCGPVTGLYRVEQEFSQLENTDVVHLRPAFFYTNFYANLGMIKHMGIMGGNYGEGTTMVLAHPTDIAHAAAEELLKLDFAGKTVRYIASDERTTNEIAAAIGAAIGKNELPWINFKNEDALAGMVQAGLSHEVARNYVEMGTAMANGTMAADYNNNKPALSATKLEAFAAEFAVAYAHQ